MIRTFEKHTVQYLSPGTLVSESTTHVCESWDPRTAMVAARSIQERHGAKPYGFRFATSLVTPTIETDRGPLAPQTKLLRESGIYFIKGRLETYDQVVKRNAKGEEIMRSNMECNGAWIVCITENSYRSTMPFGEKDFVVNADGVVIERGDDPKYVAYRADQKAKRDARFRAEHGL